MQSLPEISVSDTTDLCGTLLQTAMIAGYAIQADAIAARMPGKAPSDDLACVYQLGPPADSKPRPDLQHWPLGNDSPFSDRFIQTPGNGVSRPIPQSLNDRASFMDCFKPLHTMGGVVDAVSLRFAMPPRGTCSIVYLRCGSHAPFGGNNVWMLKHLYPVITKDVQHAHAQWAKHLAWHNADRLGPITTIAPSVDELLARLSKTELLVLNRLRLWETEREVAQAVGRSPHTIHVHVKSIYRKLMVTSRKQLMMIIDHAPKKTALALTPIPCGPDPA